MVSITGVTYSYNMAPLLENVNLSFEKGEITTIIGPNGCGKSTVLKVASRLLHPHNGKVFLGDRDINSMKLKEFAKAVSVLFQNNYIPDMTVERAVMSGRYPYQSSIGPPSDKDRHWVENTMLVTSCQSFRHKNMHELSGGERQRVYIAMVLAQDTPLIFFDEPTTYLDMSVSYEIMELIAYLNKKLGKTIVLVLHDINQALNYSDRNVLMEKGKVVAVNTPFNHELQDCISNVFNVKIKCFVENDMPYFGFFKKQLPETLRFNL